MVCQSSRSAAGPEPVNLSSVAVWINPMRRPCRNMLAVTMVGSIIAGREGRPSSAPADVQTARS